MNKLLVMLVIILVQLAGCATVADAPISFCEKEVRSFSRAHFFEKLEHTVRRLDGSNITASEKRNIFRSSDDCVVQPTLVADSSQVDLVTEKTKIQAEKPDQLKESEDYFLGSILWLFVLGAGGFILILFNLISTSKNSSKVSKSGGGDTFLPE